MDAQIEIELKPSPASRGESEAVPRVSVVLIFLNEERFLPEAVESVLAQTMDQWEMLLVDDGSTDGSTRLPNNSPNNTPAELVTWRTTDIATAG